ncbi:MAG: lipocalin-like domain-containing protein [Bacteroidaceae bacterium]
MKRIMKCMAVLLLAMTSGMQAHAQLKNILKNVASEAVSSATSGSGTADILTGLASKLLGTDTLSIENMQGIWTYSEPCVTFESENLLTSVGSTLASNKVESTLAKQLTKIGFTNGKLILTLNADSTGVVNLNGKDVEINWGVEESDLILTFPLTKKSIHMNAKLEGNGLQLSMSTDKLLTFATAITEKASTVNSTLGTLNSLMKNIKGMYLGLKFTKQDESAE